MSLPPTDSSTNPRLLRARLVLPIGSPPIENGAVVVTGNRLQAVGSFPELRALPHSDSHDLGDVILLPGLINCHCHLDYTDMAGMILPQRHFADWIKAIIAIKATWGYTEFAQSWLNGAKMLEQSGTTSVVDIEAIPELLPDAWLATSLRVWSCFEMINLRSRRPATDLVSEVLHRSRQLESKHENRCGLSPHALYTTNDELRASARDAAHRENRLLTSHVAESKEELEMYTRESGPLYDWLKAQTQAAHCGEGSPVQILHRSGYLDSPLLAAHVNELAPGDEDLLAQSNSTVVHCPLSHDYFQHSRFDWQRLESAGVNLTLGTDSLASIQMRGGKLPKLDLFAEMAHLATRPDAPSPTKILRWATENGAQALQRGHELGNLRPGYLADLIAIPYSGSPTKADESVVHHFGKIAFSMINGQVIEIDTSSPPERATP